MRIHIDGSCLGAVVKAKSNSRTGRGHRREMFFGNSESGSSRLFKRRHNYYGDVEAAMQIEFNYFCKRNEINFLTFILT